MTHAIHWCSWDSAVAESPPGGPDRGALLRTRFHISSDNTETSYAIGLARFALRWLMTADSGFTRCPTAGHFSPGRWLSLAATAALAAVLVTGCSKPETATGKGDKGEELTLTAPEPQTIYQGNTAPVTVKITRKGFNDPVTLAFDLPNGVQVADADKTIAASKESGEFTLKAAADATPGDDQTVKITAKGGSATTSVSFTLTVKKPTVAFVTNGIASFWDIAEKGARDAGSKLDVQVEVIMPPRGAPDQKRMVEDLLTRGVQGVAISPIDPDNQGDLLDAIAARTVLITQDSDAPNSKRLCYIGMDNYEAGRLCGQLVKKAMPEGGKVMIFVGRLGQANARLRRQGLIDELLDRSHDPKRYDDPAAANQGKRYHILGTRTDDFNQSKAKSLAQDALTAYPDLACMVGLFAYNPPILLDALKGTDRAGKVKIVGFDEDDKTLQAIVDGQIEGTIVQNPYRYGYESVRVLAGLAKGDRSVLPKDGVLAIPARSITRANVQEFWAELKKQVGQK